MNRRDAIKQVGVILGGTIVCAELIASCSNKPNVEGKTLFSEDDITLFDEIAETIIPETNTPGAKAANVGSFIALMAEDGYDENHQKIFVDGIRELSRQCESRYGKSFLKCSDQQRRELLLVLDAEQRQYMETKKDNDPTHYFRMMKELTLIGFFTSEKGATQTLRYVAVPGRYDGNLPYKKGDRAWAT